MQPAPPEALERIPEGGRSAAGGAERKAVRSERTKR